MNVQVSQCSPLKFLLGPTTIQIERFIFPHCRYLTQSNQKILRSTVEKQQESNKNNCSFRLKTFIWVSIYTQWGNSNYTKAINHNISLKIKTHNVKRAVNYLLLRVICHIKEPMKHMWQLQWVQGCTLVVFPMVSLNRVGIFHGSSLERCIRKSDVFLLSQTKRIHHYFQI